MGDEIWIDLNSGDKGEGLALNTFAHEMYHHVEKWNQKGAETLAEFVVKELGLKDVKSAVDAQIQKATAAGYGVEHFKSKGMTEEQAINTVERRAMSDFVADSLETMFSRGDASEAIARLKQEDLGLFDKIKEFIDEWVTKLKDWYSDKTVSQEGKKVAQLENFEKIQKLFMESMEDAGKNFSAALESVVEENAEAVEDSVTPTDSESILYSLREFEDGTRFVDVEADPHVFDNMTVAQMNEHAKKILREKFMGKVIGIDNKMFVNGEGVNEYLHPSKDIDEPTRIAKLTAAGELDNLLDAGKALPNRPDGEDGHIHPDTIDFSYFKTIFKIGNEYFEGIINIKNNKRGKLFKDVTKIKNITKDIVSSYGQNPKSNFLRDASMDSVRNPEQKVKDEINSLRNVPEDLHTVRRRLADAFDSIASTVPEKNWAAEYREKIAQAETIDSNLKITNRQIQEKTQSKNPADKKGLGKLKGDATRMRNDLDKLNRRIHFIESLKSFRDTTSTEAKAYGKSMLQQMRNQQKESLQQQLLENRVTREELTGMDSDITIMEKEFIRIAKAYEKLDAINMEVRDGEQRRKTYEANLLRYDQQIAAETDPAKISGLIEKRNEYAAKGDQFANRVAKLKETYYLPTTAI